jgi:hypothetical protein
MSTTMSTDNRGAGYAPEPVSSRVFVRCYRSYGEAKRAKDQLSVVARIPDKRMTVVARGLEWREALPLGTLYRLGCGLGSAAGAVVGFTLWALGLAATDVDAVTQTVIAGVVGLALGFLVASVVARLRQRHVGVADTGHVEPRQYDILVEEELAPAARKVLDPR